MSNDRPDADSPGDLLARGILVDQNGRPIAGANVEIRFLDVSPHRFFTFVDLGRSPARTDATGQFQMPWPDQHDSRVWGLDTRPNYWRDGRFLFLATNDQRFIGFAIARAADLTTSPVQISALPTAHFEGRVVDETGGPIRGVRVAIDHHILDVGPGEDPESQSHATFSLDWIDRESGSLRNSLNDLCAVTSVDGRFIIPAVPVFPGRFRFSATHPDFAYLETEFSAGQPPVELSLEAGSRVGLRVNLPDGKPACGFTFRSHSRNATTDMTGTCELSSLPVGDCCIQFVGEPTREWAVPDVWLPELFPGERREITVLAVRGSILRGRLLNAETREPARHQWLKVEGDLHPVGQTTHTDNDGRFEFEHPISPGRVQVRASTAWIHHIMPVEVSSMPKTEVTFLLSD